MSTDETTKPTVSTFKSKGKKRKTLFLIAAIIFIALLVWFIILMVRKNSGQTDTEARQQHVLQSALQATVYKATDQNAVVRDATSLIKGEQEGKFVLSGQELAKVYLNRANAYMVLTNYKAAAEDYDVAARKDKQVAIASLQGEIEARYRMGERKTLIPVYNKLITAMKDSTNPLASDNVAQYEANIKLLEAGKDLEI